jgi:hypothetical protein
MTTPKKPSDGRRPIGDDHDGEPDFAAEHDATWLDDARTDDGETESPKEHSGLEPTDRPN